MSGDFEAAFELILAHHKPRPARGHRDRQHERLNEWRDTMRPFLHEWVTVRTLASQLGLSIDRVQYRLRKIGGVEYRVGTGNRYGKHYEWRNER